ncbi:hypothetical protein [Streptomyces cinereoruber]|uniref:hypothetical protein n=1 Tax=Streptomyces cinereoruber TaxID=67260 RepID=UPI003F53906F
MNLTVDLIRLLQVDQEKIPGDPDVVDFGALEAARARHCAVVMGTTVHPEPHQRPEPSEDKQRTVVVGDLAAVEAAENNPDKACEYAGPRSTTCAQPGTPPA